MKKSGKNVENARKKVEARPYKLAEASELIKKTHHTKFNETVELAINLGVDPKHSDQVVRGTVVLPHGLGKSVRVLVLAGGESSAKPRKLEPNTLVVTNLSRKLWMAGRTSTP